MRIFSGNTEIPENTIEFWTSENEKAATSKEARTRSLDWSLGVLSCALSSLNSFTRTDTTNCHGTSSCGSRNERLGLENALSCFNPQCFDQCHRYKHRNCIELCLPRTLLKKQHESENGKWSFKTILLLMYNILDSLDDNSGKSTKRTEGRTDEERSLEMLPKHLDKSDHEFFNFQSSPISSPQKKRVKVAEIEKRYRLGLYDCISSYCRSLKGESRKTCIVNFCHRQSQIEE